MTKENDTVHIVLDHLTQKLGPEAARAEVRQMSLADILIQKEYIVRGPQTVKLK